MSKVLQLDNVLTEDRMATEIAEKYTTWLNSKRAAVDNWRQIQQYIYSTDTTTTSNSALPWKNKTTIPKLCQIRDNLFANYLASLFPKKKWLLWEGASDSDQDKEKTEAIRAYMDYVIDQKEFKEEIEKLLLDFIDYGNCVVTSEWLDQTQETEDSMKVGYVGPVPRRINPLDIVFNPTARSFRQAPKIISSLMTLGEAKKELEAMSHSPDELEAAQGIFNYMREIRNVSADQPGEMSLKNEYYRIDGFDSFQAYLQSDYVELLTFLGDIYDKESGEFLENYKIVIVDRHKIVFKGPNPSKSGVSTIHHAGWRLRQDNLWAMGPLENLVGMQYRIDHIENLKADLFDLTAFPPLKITGYVEDFEWGPFEKIYVGEEGNVELLNPAVEALNANFEIQQLEMKMEEMAGAPKEAMGFRTPGEKTMYEVQRLENAAARIFQAKIRQFEEKILEPLLNDMLELGKRLMGQDTVVRVFDDDLKVTVFLSLSPTDITGSGRIKPVAARNFAERAERLQNLSGFFQSAAGADVDIKAHFSSIKLAEMYEELLDIGQFKIVEPYVRLTEQADAQRIMNEQQEQVQMEAMTPAGIAPDDFDEEIV